MNRRSRDGDVGRVAPVIGFAVLAAAALVGCSRHTSSSPPSSVSPSQLRPPPIPGTGAYLGAWVLPNQQTGSANTAAQNAGSVGQDEVRALPSFNSSLGNRSVAILHVYSPLSDGAPLKTLDAIAANGSIPLIDLGGCGSSNTLSNINSNDSAVMTEYRNYAEQVKSFGKPVFVRWYWEMNIAHSPNRACNTYGNNAAAFASAYVSAWIKVRDVFKSVGAANAAFVWCPSAQKPANAFFPGAANVDWIGVDGYARRNAGSNGFASTFGAFYQQWHGQGKPMMIGETGAPASPSGQQAAYLEGIKADVPSQFPQIKAIVYFDAGANGTNWTLQGSGLQAFQQLLADPYFSYKGT